MYMPKESLFLLLVLSTFRDGLSVLDKASNQAQSPSDITTTRHANDSSVDIQKLFSMYPQKPDNVQYGCQELRSQRLISDGFCTSIKPITEVICQGHCLPQEKLQWYAQFVKVWSGRKVLEYRCVNNAVKRKRIRLLCKNGETRTYRIKVVKSCKCKRYMRQQNRTRIDNSNRSSKRRSEDEESKDDGSKDDGTTP